MNIRHLVLSAIAALTIVAWAGAAAADCHGVDPAGNQPLQAVATPTAGACTAGLSNGYPIPDATCTPGSINPTVKTAVLQAPDYTTKCTRNNLSSAAQKNGTYGWYAVPHPAHNTGPTQTCELDHLISLELGGSDDLTNIWPQCGPDGVELDQRSFKIKDGVENYLAAQVKSGAMALADAQQGIATDWTQYIAAAQAARSH